MKLRQLFLKESGDVHSFIFGKWDGQEAEDLYIQPFDVLVKYHGEVESSSDHPYGEGTATETHGADVTILSLTADEVVHVTAESGHSLDSIVDHADVSAIIFSKPGSGTLTKVQELFPDAALVKGGNIDKGTKGALELFSFFEDHSDETVIVDVDSSVMLTDIYCVNILKSILDGHAKWITVGNEREFDFTGRIIFVVPHDAQVNDAIEHRIMSVDLTKDQKYPRGTPLQSLPGWDDSHLKFFEEKAYKNFTG